MLKSSGVDHERKRHDKAIKLQAAQAAWSRKRTERLDFINEELRRQGHAVQTFKDVDEAIREYHYITGKDIDPIGPEPQLSDYYVMSNDQKDRKIAFIVLEMTETGLVAYKLAK